MIRMATPDDAEGIARVHIASWRETYVGMVPQSHLDAMDLNQRILRWTNNLQSGKLSVFVACAGQEVVGFISGGPVQQPELGYSSELQAMYLLKAHQGKGWGRDLFERFADTMRSKGHSDMYCWVIRENPTARFYKYMGGEQRQEKQVQIGGAPITEDLFLWQLAFVRAKN